MFDPVRPSTTHRLVELQVVRRVRKQRGMRQNWIRKTRPFSNFKRSTMSCNRTFTMKCVSRDSISIKDVILVYLPHLDPFFPKEFADFPSIRYPILLELAEECVNLFVVTCC